MKKLVLLAALLLGVLLPGVCAGSASADSQQVTHIRGVIIDWSGPDPYYTELCGFPVTDVYSFVGAVTLYYQDGLVVREEDLAPDTKIGYSSANGSLIYATTQPFRTEYPGGAELGSPANMTQTGLVMKLPGLGADTGLVTISGIVVGFEDGIPIVEPTGVGRIVGHWNDPSAVDAAVCAALS